jgi:NAD(P)H-quinone oxidoreductase subunit 4
MLSSLIWLPVIGALLIGFLPITTDVLNRDSSSGKTLPLTVLKPSTANSTIKYLASAIALVILLITVYLIVQFDISKSGMQFQEYFPWLQSLGISYSLGVDGISLPLVGLNALLTWLVILSTPTNYERPKFFYALVFLINAGLSGAFLAQDVMLFVLFYELELIPLYLLIAIWGGAKREAAAMKFLIYTAISGILILGGFVALGWITADPNPSFDYASLKSAVLPLSVQIPILLALLIGFGIKTPLVPLHSWLPDTYVEASTPTAILLGGILAKLGAYGLIRFCLGLFPDAWSYFAPWLAVWAAAGVLYGTVIAIAQKDIKRMVAYSSIGHMSYILLACAAATPLSLVGGVTQMVSHGLILAILFYLVGLVEAKVGTRDLDVLNGLLNPIRGLPAVGALLVLGGMASAGIPGMVGFISEFLVFQGSFAQFPIPTLLCIVGTGLTAVYFVILLNRTCFGKLDNATAYYPRVTVAEQVPALILTALIIFLGVQPTWLVRWTEVTTNLLASSMPTSRVGTYPERNRISLKSLQAPGLIDNTN